MSEYPTSPNVAFSILVSPSWFGHSSSVVENRPGAKDSFLLSTGAFSSRRSAPPLGASGYPVQVQNSEATLTDEHFFYGGHKKPVKVMI